MNRNQAARLLSITAAALVMGLLFITRQSFWMDEGSTVFKALIPDLREWWRMTLRIGGSDVQMPLYMFLVWLWAKLGAASEYALRLVNLPWLVIGALALRNHRFWPLVFLSSPFVLYYAGELRPYAMQAAAGAVAAAALLKVHEGTKGDDRFKGLHAIAVAVLFLASTSLTGAVWAAGLGAATLLLRPEWIRSAGFWKRIVLWMPAALLVGGFYGFTLLKGYRAAGTEGGIASLIFGFYELSGLMGLGPGRNEIRANPSSILHSLPVLIPAMAVMAAAWSRGVAIGFQQSTPRVRLAFAAAVLLPLLFLTGVSIFMDFRVLGRHLSPLLPAVLLPLAVCMDRRNHHSWRWPVVATAAVCFGLGSAILLRTLERHARDDYRQASSIVFQALDEGKRVWWQADMNATRYYAYQKGGFPMINAIQVLESDIPASLLSSDMVVINRPDLRYRGQDYRSELKRNDFHLDSTFTGFEIWTSR